MPINSACGVFCFGPDECEHERERKAERERQRRLQSEAEQIARRLGIDYYDPALVSLYGTPEILRR